MRRRRGLYRATLRSIFRHSRTTCAWRPRWSRLRTREDTGREWPRRGCNWFVAGCNRESSQNRLQVATQSKSQLAGGCVTVSKLDNMKSRDFKSRPATGQVEATLAKPCLTLSRCPANCKLTKVPMIIDSRDKQHMIPASRRSGSSAITCVSSGLTGGTGSGFIDGELGMF